MGGCSSCHQLPSDHGEDGGEVGLELLDLWATLEGKGRLGRQREVGKRDPSAITAFPAGPGIHAATGRMGQERLWGSPPLHPGQSRAESRACSMGAGTWRGAMSLSARREWFFPAAGSQTVPRYCSWVCNASVVAPTAVALCVHLTVPAKAMLLLLLGPSFGDEETILAPLQIQHIRAGVLLAPPKLHSWFIHPVSAS